MTVLALLVDVSFPHAVSSQSSHPQIYRFLVCKSGFVEEVAIM